MSSWLDDYSVVGRVLKPFGIKGALKVKPETNDLKRHTSLKRVFFAFPHNETLVPYTVTSSSLRKDMWFLNFKEIEDLTAAEKIPAAFLVVPREERPELPEGEYYFSDFKGLAAHNAEGIKVGKIREVMDYPGADTFVLKIKGKEVLAPWIDACVLEINMPEGYVKFDFSFLGAVYENL